MYVCILMYIRKFLCVHYKCTYTFTRIHTYVRMYSTYVNCTLHFKSMSYCIVHVSYFDMNSPRFNADFSLEGGCKYSDKKTIIPFAYRVHAHTHSTVITGYYKKSGSSEWALIGSKSPQDPQAFYPALNSVNVSSGDILAARCLYNTKGDSHDVQIGYVLDIHRCAVWCT